MNAWKYVLSLSDTRSTGEHWFWHSKVMGSRRITGRQDRIVRNEESVDKLPGALSIPQTLNQ